VRPNEDFIFDKSQLYINTVLLVNTTLRNASLSVNNPIVRLAEGEGDTPEKLLHLMRPSSEQMYKNISFTLRRSAMERFNIDSLLKLLHCLIDKYSTDYYAFMQIDRLKNGMEVNRLYQWLVNLAKYLEESPMTMSSGVYLLLKKGKETILEDESLTLQYLTTQAGAVNPYLSTNSTFNVPVGLSVKKTSVIADPVMGVDEAIGVDVQNSISKYYMITGNRLVTPADIKIFCYNNSEVLNLELHYYITLYTKKSKYFFDKNISNISLSYSFVHKYSCRNRSIQGINLTHHRNIYYKIAFFLNES
jgi:hypothetical protein